ncbi:class I SAM-dependent methyltransferase [Natrononativus amylolyticus]|uniref:class I SAM-dependent methyltransferase n=1 Tax=Natrononativus amylolyticus TaxID=2963434 RepID=UPI0020CC9F7F|nr:class I SAM-dependent methyltransferase [Natrononativus amylolyticus]
MTDKNRVRRAYDVIAAQYADHRSQGGTEVLAQFLESLSAPAHVLDAGCGQGTPVLSRLTESTTATGLDFSREQLRLATDGAPDAALVQGDMATLPFRTGTFDAVVAYWSLIHVPLEDHQGVVDEFARVLRPGGRVLVCEGTDEWCGENPDWLDTGVRMEWNVAGAAATLEQLRTAGFVLEDSWGVPEVLCEDGSDDGDDDQPWTFFAARLEA